LQLNNHLLHNGLKIFGPVEVVTITFAKQAIRYPVFVIDIVVVGSPARLGKQCLVAVKAITCLQYADIGNNAHHFLGGNYSLPAIIAGENKEQDCTGKAEPYHCCKVMSVIADKLSHIKAELGEKIQLVAVSKYRSIAEIEALYHYGQRIFAENRVQALLERQAALPSDIAWHLIGHLQRNKVKYIAPFIAMIHAVDSVELLEEINRQALKNKRVIPILLQVHIAVEETKFGFSGAELLSFCETLDPGAYPGVCVAGLMAMASNTPDMDQVGREFAAVHDLFLQLKESVFAANPSFCELSIGMSSDYRIAIQHGSTMVRIGSALFE
jgi:PLP dependent protein